MSLSSLTFIRISLNLLSSPLIFSTSALRSFNSCLASDIFSSKAFLAFSNSASFLFINKYADFNPSSILSKTSSISPSSLFIISNGPPVVSSVYSESFDTIVSSTISWM